jgi:glycosyltransferase involved in cell wall biosynthesis
MSTITIITSTLNALLQLQHTANSIFQQSTTDWQWIIVDGASSDGTGPWLQEIAQLYPNVDFISEPDHGIYDAWNKSLTLVRGEWVLFLGAGDKLKSSDVLRACIEYLQEVPQSINLAYGAVEYIKNIEDNSGKLSPAKWDGVDAEWKWCRPVLPNHQGVFHRTRFLSEQSGFDTSYRIAGDTAMMLPELIRNGAIELPLCITLRLMEGISLAPQNRVRVLQEVMIINRRAGLGSKRLMYQYSAFLYHMIKAWLMLRISMNKKL